jgi:signal peptidase I
MEANLFWIGIGLGAYAYLLRLLDRKTSLLRSRVVGIVLHAFFCGAIGSLVGFIFSASTELQGPTAKFPLVGAALGIIWALIQLNRETPESRVGNKILMEDQEWCETSYSAILLAAVIMYAVLQAFKIPSGSMEDTLLVGDHLFVNKFIYGVRVPFTEKRVFKLRNVRRGDVVVFEAPSPAIVAPEEREHNVKKDFIKRAIGLPGDIIQIKEKKLYVNGQLQVEPYAVYKDPMVYPQVTLPLSAADYQTYWNNGRFDTLRRDQVGDNFGPITVPSNCYFVMGDNRDGSFDARFWGPLPNRLLKGKALVVYWPFDRLKWIR